MGITGLTVDTSNVLALPPSVVIYGSPGAGKCLPGETRVQLADGRWQRIDQVCVGDIVVSIDHDLKLRHAPVIRTIKSGRKQLFRLRLQSGRIVTASANHPLMGRSGWATLATFKPGDFIAVPRHAGAFGGDDMSEAAVKLLAYFVADGSLSAGTPCITETYAAKIEDLRTATTVFGGVALTTTREKSHRIVHAGNVGGGGKRGNPFTTLLRSQGYTEEIKSASKFVPPCIFTLREQLVALWLNRYLGCDGCYEQCGAVSFASASAQLAYEVSHLLLRFGVFGSMRTKQVNGVTYWEWQTRNAESIENLRRRVGLFTKPIPAQPRAQPSANDVIPMEEWALTVSMPPSQRKRRRQAMTRGRAQAYAHFGDSIHRMAHSDLLWDTVKSCEPLGEAQTYDLEVAGTHNFLAEDVLVHNSTEMARAFQRVLYVQSSPSILHAFAHWAQLHPELKLTVPDRITFDENYIRDHGGSPTMSLVEIIEKYLTACDKGTSPYEGIIFDEWNTMCERVFAELKTDPWGKFKGRGGNLNIFAVFDYFKSIHRMVLSIGRRSRKMVGFVSHYQLPKLDDDDMSPTKGQIKWRGGPAMPMGLSGQMVELCADADVVLQLELKEPKRSLTLSLDPPPQVMTPARAAAAGATSQPLGLSLPIGGTPLPAPSTLLSASSSSSSSPSTENQRVFLTQLDSKWFRKVRGFGVEAEEPLDIHNSKGLRELLRRAGYPV